MIRAFVYRLYPSKGQQARMESVRESCRRFYNDCLAERSDAYRTRGVLVTKVEQLRRVKVLKASDPSVADIHSHVLQLVVTDLDRAFGAFFRRVKAGKAPGYPRFKGPNRFPGFGFKQYANGFKVDGRRLYLSGIGRVAIRWHRKLEGSIKTCRIYCRAGKWFVSFVCEVEQPESLPRTGMSVGIDLGLHRLVTLSNGEGVENPRWSRRSSAKLRVIQRSVARKELNGSNRRKAVGRLRRFYFKVAHARKDFLNKLAADLIRRFDRIVLEDLRIAVLARTCFAKGILDAGWSYLIRCLTYKAESAGRDVLLVDPAYTSKTCSGCGIIFEHLTLSARWVVCDCGISMDRDHNAARNILNRGLGRSPWAPSSSMDGLAQEAAQPKGRGGASHACFGSP